MSHRVRFMPRALADLNKLHDTIAPQGAPRWRRMTSAAFMQLRMKLETFPERVTSRVEIAEGLRTFGLERRATIAFFGEGQDVWILRVLYGRQEMEGWFGDAEDCQVRFRMALVMATRGF